MYNGSLKMDHSLVVVDKTGVLGKQQMGIALMLSGEPPAAAAVIDECVFLLGSPERCDGFLVSHGWKLSASRCTLLPTGRYVTSNILSTLNRSRQDRAPAVSTINLVRARCHNVCYVGTHACVAVLPAVSFVQIASRQQNV